MSEGRGVGEGLRKREDWGMWEFVTYTVCQLKCKVTISL